MKTQKDRDIYPNVDLYSASLYYMLKIPVDLNTPIFAISRVVGWASHIIEEKFDKLHYNIERLTSAYTQSLSNFQQEFLNYLRNVSTWVPINE